MARRSAPLERGRAKAGKGAKWQNATKQALPLATRRRNLAGTDWVDCLVMIVPAGLLAAGLEWLAASQRQ
jgi:hypothetical protein